MNQLPAVSRTFRVKASSPAAYLFTLFFILIAGVYLAGFLLPMRENKVLAVLVAISAGGLAIYTTRFTAVALATWTLSESAIRIKWDKQFILSRRPDRQIPWKEIQQYKFRPERNFDLLKIKLFDGTIIRLWHNTSTESDDFSKLIRNFEKRVIVFNEHTDTLTPIKRISTFYESKAGLVYAVFMGLCLVAIPILLIILPRKSDINWAGLAGVYGGGLFYIFKIIESRKKKQGF